MCVAALERERLFLPCLHDCVICRSKLGWLRNFQKDDNQPARSTLCAQPNLSQSPVPTFEEKCHLHLNSRNSLLAVCVATQELYPFRGKNTTNLADSGNNRHGTRDHSCRRFEKDQLSCITRVACSTEAASTAKRYPK